MATPRPMAVATQLKRWANGARGSVTIYRNWPAAVTDKWRLRGQVRLYRLRPSAGGVSLLATTWADTRILNELWLDDPYLQRAPDPGTVGVVVDVGANRGYFAVQAALRFPGAKVIAFEPEPRNLGLLRANVALNGVDVEVHPEALVPDDRTEVLLYEAIHPGFHTTLDPDTAEAAGMRPGRFTGGETAVPARNMEQAMAEIIERHGRIDVLKIDTEGTEEPLLDALSDATLAAVRFVAAEVLTDISPELRARLKAAGFDVAVDPPYLELRRP